MARARSEPIFHDAPRGIGPTMDLDAYPERMVMDYGLDTRVPQPQRAVWPSDRETDEDEMGYGY